MEFNNYQSLAASTAVYPKGYGELDEINVGVIYTALKMAGEAGEVAEKVGKILRDKRGVITEADKTALAKEIGDVLWYCSQLSRELGFTFATVAEGNLSKLFDRKDRGVLLGSGDDR